MRAVLLAAGEGRRLRSRFDRPKPLVQLLGLSLIERNILSLRECGIKDFIIITGCYANEIQDYLGNGEKLGVKVNYLYNKDWKLGNGVSAYTFHKDYCQDEKYILMMSDHLFSIDLLKDFIAGAKNIEQDEILLAADKRLKNVYALDESTKIKAYKEHAIILGKNLLDFNAVDCGLFIGTRAFLDALSKSIYSEHYTITDAVNELAELRKVKLHFINDFWVDVDDYDSYKYSEKILLQSLVPDKDGFISKHINRKFSLRITKILAQTRLKPNHISFLSFLIAVVSAMCFIAMNPVFGGLLAQLCSIIDGVDGEIARLKFQKSIFGGIFDAILDRYADYLIVIGMTYLWYCNTTNITVVLLVSVATLTGLPMSMLIKEKFKAGTGKPFIPEIHDGMFRYLPVNRDGRLFIIMIGSIVNLIPHTLIFLATITHFLTLYRVCKIRQILD